MRSFCGDSLWDWDLTWNTLLPDFTRCFEDTILVWIPCAFLWLLSPYEVYRFRNSTKKPLPWTVLVIFKLALVLILCFMTLIDMVDATARYLNDEYTTFAVEFYADFIKFLSFMLVLVIISGHRKKGLHTSGTLFFFWFLMTLVSIVTYRSAILIIFDSDQFYVIRRFAYISKTAAAALITSLFFTSCFSDATASRSDGPKKCPESTASFPNDLTYSWFTSMASLGLKKPLTIKDMWDLDSDKKTTGILDRFDKYWIPESKKAEQKRSEFDKPNKVNLLVPMVKTFWPEFLYAGTCKFVANCLTFVNPIVLDYLITFVSSDQPMWRGYFFAFCMLTASATESLLNAQYEGSVNRVGMKTRSCMVAAIFQKSLKLSSFGHKDFTTGEIVNLMAVDTQKIIDCIQMINLLWACPLQIVIAIYLLWQQLGVATLAGVAVMLAMLPLNAYFTAQMKNQQVKFMREKDKRTKLMNEVLNGIKVIKLFSWENFFSKKLLEIRWRELRSIKYQAYIFTGMTFIFSAAPFFIALASFATFVLIDPKNVLDPNIAFVSLSLFNILRVPMTFLPILFSYAVMSYISFKRINKYLSSEELDTSNVNRDPNKTEAITVEDGTFAWDKSAEPVLAGIDLHVNHKKLVAIVGEVGSGKSSLLGALLGDLHKKNGYVNVSGSLAYVPQQAWILNETVRQNIIFAKPMERTKYRKVIEACALESDLKVLEGGDMCEIGEKGINLSGGQKQRVSLARAVYSDADIYLLDDPLSAVDAHVSKHLFDKVIGPKGMLKSKTRVIVTHRITVLPQVDHIIVLKNGRIAEQGTYSELLAKKGDFAEMILEYLDQDIEDVEDPEEIAVVEELIKAVRPDFDRQISRSETGSGRGRRRSSIASSVSAREKSLQASKEGKDKARLIEAETAEIGSIKLDVYKQYFVAMGVFMFISTVIFFMILNGFNMCTSLWLTAWSNDGTDPIKINDTSLRNWRLEIYAALGSGEATFTLLSTLIISIACLHASKILHDNMLDRVIVAPMSFFDTTPLGRILNRFTKDIDVADVSIRFNLRQSISQSFRTLVALILVCLETPWFIVAAIPLGIGYYIIERYYITTSRQLRRIESVTRSPIYTHFSESVSGSNSIRAYNVGDIFTQECYRRVDIHHSANYPSVIAARWLAVRLEFLGYMIVTLAALFAVITRGSVSPGIAGLSISYAMTITNTLNMLVKANTELENNIVSIERCLEYNDVPVEAPRYIEQFKPNRFWPEKGQIEFQNYSTAYRKGLTLVLKNVNFSIKSCEKVGVVGRTGAGKSSLTLALFRIIEPVQGTIIIDNVDISKLGLHDLRSRLTIIPQDPVLFTGTVRLNLDPLGEIQDDSLLWEALELANLGNFVRSVEFGLSYAVTESGENLSVGQRQLLCLARAILRKSKILILDEATAAVDVETDDLIQKTIRTEFKDCTVVTIAHRLNTVMDYDKILVLQDGEVAEFDSPAALLENKNSIFYGMAKDAGLAG